MEIRAHRCKSVSYNSVVFVLKQIIISVWKFTERIFPSTVFSGVRHKKSKTEQENCYNFVLSSGLLTGM
jgi:hypothetical protein